MQFKGNNKIYVGDSWELIHMLPDGYLDLVMTSPPYWALRDYQQESQFGLEDTPEEFIEKLVELFRHTKFKLKDTGSIWVNINDTYAESKYHLVPEKFAIAMQDDGWWIKDIAVWYKPNKMPCRLKDKFNFSWEYVFRFSKQRKAYFDMERVAEPVKNPEAYLKKAGRAALKDWHPDTYACGQVAWAEKAKKALKDGKDMNMNDYYKGKVPLDVWAIKVRHPPNLNHPAKYPEELCHRPILACCPEGGVVLDPFMGSGTTAVAAKKLNRNFIGFELNIDYAKIALKRISETKKGELKDLKFDDTSFDHTQRSIFGDYSGNEL